MKIDEKIYNKEWFHQKVIVEKLSTREIADEIGCSQSAVIKKLSKFNLKSNQSTQKVLTEPKKQNLYIFGAKVHYVDPHEPSRQKKSREIRVRVAAFTVVEALEKAEREVKRHSNGFEFSLMHLYGSTVTIFPPKE